MENKLAARLLLAQLRSGRTVTITVTGVSMEPTLLEGDSITLSAQPDYQPGDILVYPYKQDTLLVHRLLEQREGLLWCKGDNALRLEDIPPGQVIGKVIRAERNGSEISLAPWPPRLLRLSRLVNRAFVRCRYNPDQTKNTQVYQVYQAILNNKGDFIMQYQKNATMEYIQSDESSLAVFDPASGNTHFFDETGINILACLEQPTTLEALLDSLCKLYQATPQDIRADVEEFLDDCVEKGVVEAL